MEKQSNKVTNFWRGSLEKDNRIHKMHLRCFEQTHALDLQQPSPLKRGSKELGRNRAVGQTGRRCGALWLFTGQLKCEPINFVGKKAA